MINTHSKEQLFSDRFYQPKGSMCLSCVKSSDDCSHLDFKSMQPIEQYEDTVIVKCTEYEKCL